MRNRIVIASKSNKQKIYEATEWTYSYSFVSFIKALISEVKECKKHNRTIVKIYTEEF